MHTASISHPSAICCGKVDLDLFIGPRWLPRPAPSKKKPARRNNPEEVGGVKNLKQLVDLLAE
jgi:hypothetical protein